MRNSSTSCFRWGVIVFPGSNCELETLHVLTGVFAQNAELVWHEDRDVSKYDVLVLPGGFAHGDYLRAGAIARFSPVMEAVDRFARSGRLVLGICNGFQVLLEAGMLPGAMRRNTSQNFASRWVNLRVECSASPFLQSCSPGEVLRVPVAHGEGNYFVDESELSTMNANGQILLRYCDPTGEICEEANPNGSIQSIAGICCPQGNVMGLMPHPERASEAILGSDDGCRIFQSMIDSMTRRAGAAA